MDTYAMVLLALIVGILLAMILSMAFVVVSRKNQINNFVADNATRLNYPEWKAKRDETRQRMKELNADFVAIIEGE